METNSREKQITKTSMIGIIANVFLAAFKAGIGVLAGSIAIILDAVNNITDALSSVITIAGIKLSKKKPDEKHPYGYGRIEYFSAILISGLVLSAGLMSLIESVKKIFAPEIPDYTAITLLIIAVAVNVKLALGRYVKSQGKKYNSDALIASGSDASFDAILSASTFAGAAITMFFHVSVDGIIGAVISIFIVKAGIEMFLESVGNILGVRPDSEITKEIKARVNSIDGINGAYDLVLHNYGPDYALGSIHIEIDASLTAAEVHSLCKQVQQVAIEEFNVFLTVGIYAIDAAHNEAREFIKSTILANAGTLGAHGICFDDSAKTLSLDVVLDFSVKDKEAMYEHLKEELLKLYPEYQITISFDTNYSG